MIHLLLLMIFSTILEEQQVCSNVILNDITVDAPIDTLKFKKILNGPKNGNATVIGKTICYTPKLNFTGLDTIKYIVCDTQAVFSPTGCNGCAISLCPNCNMQLCDTALYIITVNNINDAPVASNDIVSTNEDTPICVNVLNNDIDVDNPIVDITAIFDQPNNGDAIIVGNQICYTPNPNYFGKDSLQYIICDRGTPILCDTAYVIITVNPVNDKPIAVDDATTIVEDNSICLNVLSNDINVDGDIIAITNLSNTPNNGNATINGSQVCYTPNPNFNGKDTIEYVICDNGTPSLCDTGKIIITVTPVNDKPQAVDDVVSTNEDVPVCKNVLSNDINVDGDVITITGISNNASNGTAVINGNQICYTPNPDFNGKDTIEYVICDNATPSLCDTGRLIITVNPINDKPIAVDDATTIVEDNSICLNVLSNDINVDGDIIAITNLSNTPNNGNATINGSQVCYTPNSNFNGIDTIEYVICDNGIPSLCDTGKIIITVTPVNDKPQAIDDVVSTNEDVPVCKNVLSNDINVDGDVITITGISNNASNGTAVINGNQICYTPNPDFNGKDTIEYVICDNATPSLCDTGRLIITVNPVNDNPIANDDNVTIKEDNDTCVSVIANDNDIDGPNLIISGIFDLPNNGNASIVGEQICYTPNPDFNGKDTIQYIVCDQGSPSKCDTARIIITVQPVPDSPKGQDDNLITNEDTPKCITVTSNDSDPDQNDIIKICDILTPPSHGTVTITQGNNTQVCYTPDPNFNGDDTLCIVVCDNSNLKDTTCIFIKVNPVPDAPIAVDDRASTQVNVPVNIPILSNDSDPDGDVITPSIVSQPVNGGSVTLNANGTVTYTPLNNFNGLDTFTYKICDPSNRCDEAIVVIVVGLSDTDIFALDDRCIDVFEDVTTSLNVTVNDLVKDPLNIFIRLVNIGPYFGTAVLSQDQKSFNYTPRANYFGKDSLIYEACLVNKPNKCDRAFVCINVIPLNDQPIANKDSVFTNPDTEITIDVQANDVDLDGKGLVTTEINDAPNHGTAVVVNADSIIYTPLPGYIGFDTLTYTICELGVAGLCDDTIVIINVGVVNQAPIAIDDTIKLYNNTSTTVNVLNNDIEPDGDPIIITILNPPIHGTISTSTNGVYTYTPFEGYVGLDSFVYQICDDATPPLCDQATVHIEVKKFIIPNIFTPNGDGNHDTFIIPGISEFPDNRFTLFNRWGDIVYESAPYDNTWDGREVNNGMKLSGKGLPDGTYYYILILNNEIPPFKGFITIKK
jgi:gliding motility-associated-like protein